MSVPGKRSRIDEGAETSSEDAGVISAPGLVSGETDGLTVEIPVKGEAESKDESVMPAVLSAAPVHTVSVTRNAQTSSSVSRRKRERICFMG